MVEKDLLWGSRKLSNVLESWKYDLEFKKAHPDYFMPDGIVVFTGRQGAGKTLSAVNYIWKLSQRYPDVMIVSNCALNLKDYKHDVIRYQGYEHFAKLDNGYKGIILFLDEIQSEFNSLDSKNIDPVWFQVISMQRKRRLHVVGTAQIFSRVAKAWREQFSNVVECNSVLKYVQFNRLIDAQNAKEVDGELIYDVSKPRFWFRYPECYTFYDTWERVKKVEDNNRKGRK